MAKICMVALVLAALVATSFAGDAVFGRGLQQANARRTYTCAQAANLAGPAVVLRTVGATGCDDMLACLRRNAGSLINEQNLALFKRSCSLCAAATKTCATPALKAGPVPSACRAGLSITPVTKCVDELLVALNARNAAPVKVAAKAPAKTAAITTGH